MLPLTKAQSTSWSRQRAPGWWKGFAGPAEEVVLFQTKVERQGHFELLQCQLMKTGAYGKLIALLVDAAVHKGSSRERQVQCGTRFFCVKVMVTCV